MPSTDETVLLSYARPLSVVKAGGNHQQNKINALHGLTGSQHHFSKHTSYTTGKRLASPYALKTAQTTILYSGI